MTFIPFTKYDSIRSILLRSLEQGTGEPVNCINRSMEVSLRKRLPPCPFRVSSDRCCLLLCCLCTVCLFFFSFECSGILCLAEHDTCRAFTSSVLQCFYSHSL